MKRTILALALSLALGLSLTACSPTPTGGEAGSPAPSEGNPGPEVRTTLRVAASPTPHAEILAQVKETLAAEGIDLVVTEYGDYIIPNTAVEEGDEDVNYFQHQPYLDQFNEENGTHLVSVAAIHYEPFGVYPGKTKTLEELPDGALVGVPSDVTNEARALQLLEDQGLIKLREGAGLKATPNDIVENPKGLKFQELEAAMLPNVTSEMDIAVINGNYALQAGFSSTEDAIALEDAASESAQACANVIVVKEGRENDPAVQALVEALTSDGVRAYINDSYSGNVQPIF